MPASVYVLNVGGMLIRVVSKKNKKVKQEKNLQSVTTNNKERTGTFLLCLFLFQFFSL